MIFQVNAKDKSLPMLPANICLFLPHILAIIRHTSIAELKNILDFMNDTSATTNTYKLSIMIEYCKRYPKHFKAMFDSRNGDCCPIPLAGAIGDNTVLPTMSTYLPVVIILATPYFIVNTQERVMLTFACGEDLFV